MPLLALYNTEVQNNEKTDGHDKHPIGGKQNRETHKKNCTANIHRISQPRENPVCHQSSRRLPRFWMCAGDPENDIGRNNECQTGTDKRNTKDHPDRA
jgi:hypothetical protein